jgi:hypothetical protein
MARPPAALIVRCPICNAQPGDPCVRLRVLDGQPVRSGIRPHIARRVALEDRNRETGTIR